MSVLSAHPRLALLLPWLVATGCADGSKTPDGSPDAGNLDLATDPWIQLPSLEAMPAIDVAPSPEAPADAPIPRPPATRDAPAGEARAPTTVLDGGYVLDEDFTSTGAAEWQALDVRDTKMSTGEWSVNQGDSGSILTQGKIDTDTWHIIYADVDLAQDQIVEARLRMLDLSAKTASYMAALFGRYDPNPEHDSGYFVALRGNGSVTLRKRENGSSASWGGSTAYGIRAGKWYTVRLEIIGATLTAFIDGVEVCHVTDESPLAGSHVGLGAFGATLEVDRILAVGLDSESGF